MDAFLDEPTVDPRSKYMTNREKRKRFVQQVVTVPMKEWPEEAIKGGASGVRQVTVYLDGTRKLWLHWTDLGWLLKSICINHQLKGVADVASDDEGPDAGQSSNTLQTPEKLPRPLEAERYLWDKLMSPP